MFLSLLKTLITSNYISLVSKTQIITVLYYWGVSFLFDNFKQIYLE